MDITVKGRHWKVTAEYRAYAEQRIEKLRRYFSHLVSAQLTVTQEGYRHQAELRLIGNGVDLRGSAQDADPRVALDSVLVQQEQALKRRKDRLTDRKKRGNTMRRDLAVEIPVARAAKPRDEVDIVRVKPRQRTLTVAQAARVLLKSTQPLLVFSERDGGGLRVAYRMGDGQVGLLELD